MQEKKVGQQNRTHPARSVPVRHRRQHPLPNTQCNQSVR